MPPRNRKTTDPPDEERDTSPAEEQHPALDDDPGQEVAQRTPAAGGAGEPDQTPEPSDQFEMTMVLAGSHFGQDHPSHTDNARAVLESALQRGLHPKGDVELVGLEFEEPSRYNRYNPCTHAVYRVQVVPAVVDDPESNALETVTPGRLNESLES